MNPSEAPGVRQFFAEHGFDFREQAHAFWQARGPGCNATFYTSGKLLLQGKEADVWRGLLGELSPDARPYHRALAKHPTPQPAYWAGTDEAGKGDYFGPLVVAGVALSRADLEILHTLGVDDSKAVADGKIPEIERGIKALCATEIVLIGPEKYNELYARIGNLNRLLAWAHGKVIEALLEREGETPIDRVLIDRFAGEPSSVVLWVHAVGPFVSISGLALSQTLLSVQQASPRAARTSVGWSPCQSDMGSVYGAAQERAHLASGREFVSKHGHDALRYVGKLHFATTEQIGR